MASAAKAWRGVWRMMCGMLRSDHLSRAYKERADGSHCNQDERRERRNETTPQWYKSPQGGYQGRRQSR